MDFSSLASYWQIKALLMPEPSVVTPQNQYFPANAERMSASSRDVLENTPPRPSIFQSGASPLFNSNSAQCHSESLLVQHVLSGVGATFEHCLVSASE